MTDNVYDHVWVIDPETNKFLRDEYHVPEEEDGFKFTTDELQSGFYSPHYQLSESADKASGLVTGGQWVDLDPKPELPEIEITRSNMKLFIDHRRDRRLKEGAPITLNGGVEDTVQTRNEQDMINVSGMVQKALLLQSQGVTEPVIRFRFLSDTTRYLTPDEMIAVGNQVADHRESIYEESWNLKDALSTASSVEEIELIMEPYSSEFHE